MTHRVFRVLAWSTLAASVALALGGATLAASNLPAAFERGSIVFTIPSLAFCVVGALVASRFSRNPVGWLILAFGVTGALSLTLEEYARIGLVSQPGSLLGRSWRRERSPCSPTGCPPVFSRSRFSAFPTAGCRRNDGEKWCGWW